MPWPVLSAFTITQRVKAAGIVRLAQALKHCCYYPKIFKAGGCCGSAFWFPRHVQLAVQDFAAPHTKQRMQFCKCL